MQKTVGSMAAHVLRRWPWLAVAVVGTLAAAPLARPAHADELDAAAADAEALDAAADHREDDSAFLESMPQETWDLGPGECVYAYHCANCAQCVSGKCQAVVPLCGDATPCAAGSVCTVPQGKPLCAATCVPAPATCQDDADCPACNTCTQGVCSWSGVPKACNGGKGCPENAYCQLGAKGACSAVCVLKAGYCNLDSDCTLPCHVCWSGQCGYHPGYTCKGNYECPKGQVCQFAPKPNYACLSTCVAPPDATDATVEPMPDVATDAGEVGQAADAPLSEFPPDVLGPAADAKASADGAPAAKAQSAADSGCAAASAAAAPVGLAWLVAGAVLAVGRRRDRRDRALRTTMDGHKALPMLPS